jgi:hemerythrin
MALVTWDQSYSVKVARCDNDHKKLFTLINTLHDAMAQGKGADVVQQTVQELLDYTRVHFSAEEALMQKAGYAELATHRAQHQEFVRKVEQFQKDLQVSKTGKAVVVLGFLKDWLSKHIKQTDQRYSAQLNAQGIS